MYTGLREPLRGALYQQDHAGHHTIVPVPVSGNIPRDLYSDLLDFQIAFVHQQQQCTLSKYMFV